LRDSSGGDQSTCQACFLCVRVIDPYEIFLRREVPLSTAAAHLLADIKLQARRAREKPEIRRKA
jgi:hypothetical protein